VGNSPLQVKENGFPSIFAIIKGMKKAGKNLCLLFNSNLNPQEEHT
jgi:hypothetical protein